MAKVKIVFPEDFKFFPKTYIKNNFEPILFGFALAFLIIKVLNLISDVIIKIALIIN